MIHHDYCGSMDNIQANQRCNYDKDALFKDYKTQCSGNKECHLNIASYISKDQVNKGCDTDDYLVYI